MLLRAYLQTKHQLPRRKITLLIDNGKVFINKEKVNNYKAELHEKDLLEIPDIKLQEYILSDTSNTENKKPDFILFNKPKGYTCSKADPYNQVFYDLLPQKFRKYYYIGRLDKESRGLMLLTSKPELVHQFEHPSKEIEKSYLVQLDKPFDRKLKNKILAGIFEWGEFLRTKQLKKSDFWLLEITLNEGKKRHIRRIFKALGYVVTDLQRIRIGSYCLGSLPEGKWKFLD
mgnify:FL=1